MISIEVELTDRVHVHLERLVNTGFYGGTVEQAAERLICQALEERDRDTIRVDERPFVCPASSNGDHFKGCGCD